MAVVMLLSYVLWFLFA